MEISMTKTTPEQNKALVLEAFNTLFNKRDYEAAARFWSDTYIQHSAHIEPGRDGIFNFDPQHTRHTALRTSAHCRGGRLRHGPRTLLRNGPACRLGRRGYCQDRER